jgi:hypothetical protein
VQLDLECLDRIYLNAYIPNLQVAGQHPRALSGLAVTSEDCATRSPVATHGFKAVGQPEWWGPFR